MMVFTHFFDFTINSHLISSKLIFAANTLASYLSVPLFYFIVGYTLVISLNEKRRKGYSDRDLTKYILVRSSLIYLVGFILNLYNEGLGSCLALGNPPDNRNRIPGHLLFF